MAQARSLSNDLFTRGLMSLVGAQNPELFVEYATAAGMEPPPIGTGAMDAFRQEVPSLESLFKREPQNMLPTPGAEELARTLPGASPLAAPSAVSTAPGTGLGSIEELLGGAAPAQSPFAGLRAPEAPQAEAPGTPAAPRPSQPIPTDLGPLAELLLSLNERGVAGAPPSPVPNLARMIGGG